MKGNVLGFNDDQGVGHILSDDKRFSFVKKEWLSSELPKSGQVVDFVVQDDNATAIYLVEKINSVVEAEKPVVPVVEAAQSMSKVRNMYIAYIVGFFLFPIGIITLILSYVFKHDVKYSAHYMDQIKTFWLTLLIAFFGVFNVALAIVIWPGAAIFYFVRMSRGMRALEAGHNPDGTDYDIKIKSAFSKEHCSGEKDYTKGIF